jgi:hypothetical protein
MQTSLQQPRTRTIVRAHLDKRQVQLRPPAVRPQTSQRPLNREQKQKLVFFSQVRAGTVTLKRVRYRLFTFTDVFMPASAALAPSPVANGEWLTETASQRSLAAAVAHIDSFELQQEEAHDTYTRISGFGEVGEASLGQQGRGHLVARS